MQEEAVIRKFRITASDGKTYDTRHYNLSATIAVGYKVNSERAVRFRKWATLVVEEFTITASRWTTSASNEAAPFSATATSKSGFSASDESDFDRIVAEGRQIEANNEEQQS